MRRIRRFVLAEGMILALAVAAFPTINYTPSSPNVEQPVTFTLTGVINLIPNSIRWNFGDGSLASAVTTVSHVYARTGTMLVTVDYQVLFGRSFSDMHEETTVTVVELRRITASSPAVPLGQAVTFTAENFVSTSVAWNFGDGTPTVVAGRTVSHTYLTPGSFLVTARDNGGSSAAAFTTTILVVADYSRRRILVSMERALPLQTVVFTAVNFFTTEIRWDFGDGTPPLSGTTTAAHAYVKPGSYLVRAWDWDGRIGEATSASVLVEEPTGPRAPFQIFFLQLRFEDGLAYKVVPKGYPSLVAFLDLKYEGTGLFQAQWLVDGMPFLPVMQALPFAQSTTLNSGQTPALPTHLPGIHEVSLRILQPQSALTVPVIRYFVSIGADAPALQGLSLQVERAEGLKGVKCDLHLDRLSLPSGHYFILDGSIAYTVFEPVRFGLLRVHVGGQLVDQQILRDLKSGEKRAFVTSIYNPDPKAKTVYITLYDITDPTAPRLLFLKRLGIVADHQSSS